MIDLSTLTIEKAHAAFAKGEYTSRDLVQAYLDAIKEKNNELHAYLEVFEDALVEADKADQMIKEGKGTMLTGIPFATKDNILIEGKHASASSKILGNYVATYDSTVIKLLKEAGAIILGRTNMDEFAMGSSTQTSAYGVTRNPHDTSRVPGGSSGGSAVAVASDMTLAALGTETCGSVRQPAAFCGLVGLKPTYGALSRNGLIAMGNSLDQPAPFTKTVADSEIIFKALSHYDPLDSTSVPENMRINPSVSTADTSPSQGRKNSIIGVPRSFFAKGLDPEVEKNFEECLEKLKAGGYSIVDLDMPDLDFSLAVYYIIMPAEVSTNLSRFDGIRYGHHEDGKNLMEVYMKSRGVGFGKEARRRILLGTYVLSHGYYDAYYNKAVLLRDKITREINETFKKVDYILTPTVPTPAFKLGEKMDDPVAMYLCDIFSAPANLAGVPSIALPSGKTEAGLPMSIQFMAPHFREDALFAVGKAFENLR